MIGLAPYIFNYYLDRTRHFFEQIYHFPILKHKQMEYHGTSHGNFIETIFKKNYKNWYNFCFKMIDEKAFDLNDIDGARNWRQTNTNLTVKMHLKASEHFAGYKVKRYPETIERNIEILKNYIKLCRERNIIPIGFLLPFSQMARKHYPENSIRETLNILETFKEDMFFINLWNKQLPDSYFRDDAHLKMNGGILCTNIIKECISRIFDK